MHDKNVVLTYDQTELLKSLDSVHIIFPRVQPTVLKTNNEWRKIEKPTPKNREISNSSRWQLSECIIHKEQFEFLNKDEDIQR